ncbi:NAD(P)-dependent oxidoreductase [Martelella mangrovi]|uniref:3-hydroxyisobutyrate dehydrogenase n=1 Tax=Martelella mangrovi TaxID=1397477 RepID=A0ABV2IA40_9HYPH
MANVAFLGLGVMGYPMAGHLASKGHDVTVYNRTAAKARKWSEEKGGASAPTPAAAASEKEIVFCCVGNDDDLRAVTLGEDGAFSTMSSGSVFVDHTTASAEVARELYAAAAERGIAFIDAPVSGGEAGAVNGVLTVMCGGDEEAFSRAQPVMECYGQSVRLVGAAGSGQLAKMVNQICIGGLVQALSEGIHFAQKAELDVELVLEIITKGAAGSWQMENRGKTMNDDQFDFGFAVDLMRKDLNICLAEARRNGASLPVTAVVDQFYSDIQKAGGGRWDTSSLIRRLK